MNDYRSPYGLIITGLVIVLGILISGCGGGGGGGASTSTGIVSVIQGVVKDGPIRNARVYIDLNFDGVYNAGEPHDITDNDGRFAIEYILDEKREYILAAEGSAALGTIDPVDNAGAGNLEFVMFTTVEGAGLDEEGEPIPVSVSQDLTPTVFKEYLTKLDEKLGGSLDTQGTSVKTLIQSTSSNETTLFQSTILNNANKNTFQQKLQQVAQLIKIEKEKEKTTTTKVELGVDSESEIGFSTASTDVLTQELAFVNKTKPVKIGDVIISSTLKQLATTSGFRLFLTPYSGVLGIPEYGNLKSQNYKVIYGADITVKDSNGARVAGLTNPAVINSVRAGLTLPQITQTGLTYLRLTGNQWTPVTSGIQVSSGNSTGLTPVLQLEPMVLAIKNGLQTTQTVSVPGYSVLSRPAVVIKGSFTGEGEPSSFSRFFKTDSTSRIQNLDAGLLINGQVSYQIPNNFKVDEVVVMSQKIAQLTTENRVSIKIPVKNGTAQDENTPPPFRLIEEAGLKEVLTQGSGLEGFGGLKAFIGTKAPYENTSISFTNNPAAGEETSAHQLILQNANAYLSGGSTFSAQGISNLSWTRNRTSTGTFEYSLTASADSGQISLTLNAKNGAGLQEYSETHTWVFTQGKVRKQSSVSYARGDRAGTARTRVVNFSRTESQILVAVFDDSRVEYYKPNNSYQTQSSESYRGSAIYQHDANLEIQNLLNARFSQKLDETTTLTSQSRQLLNGLVNIDGANLAFQGDFIFTLSSYGQVKGKVSLEPGATTAKGLDGGFFNNNTLTGAVFSTNLIPTKSTGGTVVATDFLAQWTGTFSDSCAASTDSSGTVNFQIGQNSQSWVGQSGNQTRFYGTTLAIQNGQLFLYNKGNLWSTGSLNETKTAISGNWSDSVNNCSGSFTANKN